MDNSERREYIMAKIKSGGWSWSSSEWGFICAFPDLRVLAVKNRQK